MTTLVARISGYLGNEALAWNVLSTLVIAAGIVLLIGGLFLMFADSNPTQTGSSLPSHSVASIMSIIPGIPFYMGDLTQSGTDIIGLASWIVGLDLLLIGLGLWVRHRLAQLAAMSVFTLAAYFNFIQFLLNGLLGSPTSVFEMSVDILLLYILVTRFQR